MNTDHTPMIGMTGTVATILLEHLNSVISILVGIATLGYVITRWYLLVKRRKDE